MSSTQQLLLGEGAVNAIPAYIEEVFSCFLYTGNGSTQTITNNIDLSTKGGLVWIKQREDTQYHLLFDTARGITNSLSTNLTAAQESYGSYGVTAFNTTGFAVTHGAQAVNINTKTYVSWTFREQPKFFDVVTYTGNGSSTQTISHSLGSIPGCIMVKKTSNTSRWSTYHRSLTAGSFLKLETTAAQEADSFMDGANAPTSTTFTAQLSTSDGLNANGATYVAYLFAHDAGGFGLTGTDNVISCGSFSGNTTVSLGYEPQWILLKRSSGAERWYIIDNMRGWPVSGDANYLAPNTSDAENQTNQIYPNATGFSTSTGGGDFIYVAIRRGPMKVPTLGTTVFSPVARSGTGVTASTITAGFALDLHIVEQRQAGGNGTFWRNKLVGTGLYNENTTTREEFIAAADFTETFSNTGVSIPTGSNSNRFNYNGYDYINWMFGRAPGFMDIVCYTGTGGAGSRSLTHNLSAVPEFIILKRRDVSSGWQTGSMFTSTTVTRAVMNSNADQDLNSLYSGQSIWGGQPTSSAFLVDAGGSFNTSAGTYIAYLFATCAGVSKVGTYTGTGALQTVNCGFTTGARFVLIKRVNTSGNWWVYDSARGITAGNDPYLFLNAIDTEVTSTNYVDTDTTGFKVTAAAPAELNANGGTYLFLAIA